MSTGVHADILIGQTTGLTGNSAINVSESNAGAKLLIDNVNANGGINGQRVVLASLDDKGDAKIAAANARTLIEERGVIALFMVRGTPQNEAILPVLEKFGVPEIAPSTGAMVLARPLKRYVFNVRSTYQLEAEQAIPRLASMGISRIAVLRTADSFGADSVIGVERGLLQSHLKAVLVADFDKAKPDFKDIVPRVVASDAQAVVVLGTGAAVVKATQELRAGGSGATIVTLSNNASAGFIRELGPYARGVVVTQAFPGERDTMIPMIRDARAILRAHGQDSLSPAMIEGFAAAEVLVEALRRAGKKPTSSSLYEALESMSSFDLGGLKVHYSRDSHEGLVYADFSIIDGAGNFRR
jgi:branched-chain amino acid transport system substrate-binding protein